MIGSRSRSDEVQLDVGTFATPRGLTRTCQREDPDGMGGTTGRFVGRETELTRTGEAFARARSGVPSILLIEGDAGIGKSRLVAEAMAVFSGPDDVIAVGHGVELAGGELPYGVVADSLRSL